MKMLQKGNVILILLIIITILIGMVVAGYFVFVSKDSSLNSYSAPKSTNVVTTMPEIARGEVKSLHFVNSSPKHNETFVASPYNVVVNFNFDLATGSEIKIAKDSQDVGVGETTIDSTKLALRRRLPEKLEDGNYRVSYKACWPDGSCHEGSFSFMIDTTKKTDYKDMTKEEQITISMKDTKFSPNKVMIKSGTKITWVNDDTVTHYINTDPHAGHNHYIYLNSQKIELKDKYTYTFETPGEYPYHCSAHASYMTGRVLVVE